MTKSTQVLYLTLAAVYCMLSFFAHPFPLHWLVKILPLLLLLGTVIRSSSTDWKLAIICALVFSMAGDVFLAVDRQKLFVFGLGAFLLGHLSYIKALWPIKQFKVLPLFGFIVFAVTMFYLMQANLGSLMVPVVCYLIVISCMALMTFYSQLTNPWLMLGGLSFVTSDALIGLDKFYMDIPHAGLLIMLTYYLAQFSLVKGFLFSQKNN
ncbi:MAG: lysoplasmalogenase [Gammaproteobacteria bacterium]|nr:lysoplasmalogenase [Gammaproteobacteria bacterium]